MGIWSDLWTGGGGITQDLYNEKFKPLPSYEPAPQDEFANFDFFQPEPTPAWQGPQPPADYAPAPLWQPDPQWQDDSEFGNWEATSTDPAPNYSTMNTPWEGWASAGDNPFGNFTAENNFNYPADRWQDQEFGNFEVENPSLWSMLRPNEQQPDYSTPPDAVPAPSPEPFGFGRANMAFDADRANMMGDPTRPFEGLGARSPYGSATIADDGFASSVAPYQPREAVTYPNDESAFGDWAAAYEQTGSEPSLAGVAYTEGADAPLPGEYRDDFWKATIARNNWTPDQAEEQISAWSTPTIQDYFDLAQKEYTDWKRQDDQNKAILEHEQLTPRFGGLEDIYNTIAPDDSPAAQEERDYLKGLSDKELFGYGAETADWKSKLTEHALTPLEAFGLVGSLPGQAVEKGLSFLPEKIPEPLAVGAFNPALGVADYAAGRGDEKVTNPLANDYFAESIAGPMANVLVGAALMGAPGAFLGGMAPVWRPDEETGMSAWDQMDWKQRALVVGTNIINAKLITGGHTLEAAFGGETALGRTAAGVAINALVPLTVGGWEEVLGQDVDWKTVAEQAVIWGGVRGLMGVAPIIREQQKVAVPDPESVFGMAPDEGLLYSDTMDIRRKELPKFKQAWESSEAYIRSLGEEQGFGLNAADELPANQLLISKLASEYRGETPRDAFNAVQEVVNEHPEATTSLALTVKLAMEVGDSPNVPHVGEPTILRWEGAPPSTALFDVGQQRAAPAQFPGSRPLPESEPPSSNPLVANLQNTMDTFVSPYTATPVKIVVADIQERGPLAGASDAVWSEGNVVKVNPRVATGEAIAQWKATMGTDPTPQQVAKATAALTHSMALLEGTNLSSKDPYGDDIYRVDEIQTEAFRSTPATVDALAQTYSELLAENPRWITSPAPGRMEGRLPQTSSYAAAGPATTKPWGTNSAILANAAMYAEPIKSISRGVVEAAKTLPGAQLAGIDPDVVFTGFMDDAKDTLAIYTPPGGAGAGAHGAIALNPHTLVALAHTVQNVVGGDFIDILGRYLTQTLIHEVNHSTTVGGGHGTRFQRGLGFSMAYGGDAVEALIDKTTASLRGMDKFALERLLKDATHRADTYPSRSAPAGTKYYSPARVASAGDGGTTQSRPRPIRGSDGGNEPGVHVTGDTARDYPERLPEGSDAGTGTTGVREGGPAEPGSTAVRRTDGQLDETTGDVGTEGTGGGVRESGTPEPGRDTEAAADQVDEWVDASEAGRRLGISTAVAARIGARGGALRNDPISGRRTYHLPTLRKLFEEGVDRLTHSPEPRNRGKTVKGERALAERIKEEEKKYSSGRSEEEEGKARQWGTINEEEGSALAHYAVQLAAGLGAGWYGYASGDTEEEKLRRMTLYGIAGFLGGNFISGGRTWTAVRRMRGKPIKLPDPGESFTREVTELELQDLADRLGPMADNYPEEELKYFVKVARLNAIAEENQQIIIDGINAPIVAFRHALQTAFGVPEKGSTAEMLKTSQMQIIGHGEHLVDATNRHIKEIYAVSKEFLDTPEKRLEWLLAFEQPERWSHALESPEAQFTAFGAATVFNEWGSPMADAGMLNSAAIYDPEGVNYYAQNYVTHIYSQLSPIEKLEVLKGSGGGWNASDIEKARNYNTLSEAIMFGLVPKDVDITTILARYVRVANRRLTAMAQMQQVSELAQLPDRVFIPESEYISLRNDPDTVFELADYERVDSPLFRNRVNPNDTKFLIGNQVALHQLKVMNARFQRLAGSHGRKAKELETRAFRAAERMNNLEKKLLDEKTDRKERIAARDQLLTELRAEGATTLNDVVKAVGERARAGKKAQEAGLGFGRIVRTLELRIKELDKLEDSEMTDSPEAADDLDAGFISTLKESMKLAMDDARDEMAVEREPEISSGLVESAEEAAEAFDRKEALSKAAKLAKETEEKKIKEYRNNLKLQSRADDLELNDSDLRMAQLEGQIKELDFLVQRDLKKAIGPGGKALGHEEFEVMYRQHMEQAVEVMDQIKEAMEAVRQKVALDREPLMTRKDVAPLFRWTQKDAMRESHAMNAAMKLHSKWVNTLLSGPLTDFFMIGVGLTTQAGQAFTGQVSPFQAMSIAKEALKQSVMAMFSKNGNQAWWERKQSWIKAIRESGGGLDQATGDEFFGSADEIETLLGWVPVLGKLYERGVKATTRAQFSGAMPVLKEANIEARFYRNLEPHLKASGGGGGLDELRERVHDNTGSYSMEDFQDVRRAALQMGVSQYDIEQSMQEASRVMDMYYGGRNWKISDITPTMQSILRLTLLAPNWFLTRVNLFGIAIKDIMGTIPQIGENFVEWGANAVHRVKGDGEAYQRKFPHPFDLASQPGKDWALGTAMFGVSALVLALIGMSAATESFKSKKLKGPDWNYIEDELRAALTDPAHFMEVRDPWTGAYWGPLTWQKDFLRVGVAAWYMVQGNPDMAWETLGSYGKARLGPLPRSVWNLMIGRNFAGKKISPEGKGPDDPQWVQDQAINFFKENQPQIFSETEKAFPLEFSLTGNTVGQKLGMGYVNPLFGMMNMLGIGRARTQTPLDKAFWADHEATNPDGTPKYPEIQDARNYYALDPAQRKLLLERHEGEGLADYLRSGLPKGYVEETDQMREDAKALTQQVEAGKRGDDIYTFAQYREDMKQIADEKRGAGNSQGFTDRVGGSDEEKLLQSYYGLYDKATVNGILDGDLFNTLYDEWVADHDAKDVKYVFDFGLIGDPEPMARYSRAIQKLKEMDAFDTPRHDPTKYKSGKTEEEIQKYIDESRSKLIAAKSDSFGGDAIIAMWRKEKGLPPTGPLNSADKAFVDDIRLTMGKANNPAYLDMHEEHPGLFAWLDRKNTYADILLIGERDEPDDIWNYVINGD